MPETSLGHETARREKLPRNPVPPVRWRLGHPPASLVDAVKDILENDNDTVATTV